MIDQSEQNEIIRKFEEKLLENVQDLEPEFQKVWDENYWELLEE